MLTTSLELKNAFMQNERTISIRIKIGLRTFDNDDVISVEYNSGSLIGEVFAIGSTYSNSIKITFSNLVEGLKELDEVSYEIGIELPNGLVEYVPMGIFIINEAIEMDRNNNKTTIECMDKMVMMGGAYVSSLIYPAPIREVALEIANKAGIQVSDTFDRLSADKIAKPEGYTCREAIGLIAQFEAGFATFDRYGKLTIRGLSDPNFAIPPDNYFSKGLVKNEVFFRLGGISCTTDDNSDATIQSGNTLGNQIVLENRVMTKVLLDKIYQKIQIINYYPFSLKWQGNPILEAGDWIEVEDLEGNKFKTPNLNYKLTFNGGLSAESSAETATQSNATYQYKSPLQQKIEWINARIDAAGGNVIFEGIDQPVNPNEGDLWFKKVGPDTEIWIYTKDSIGNLSWEFKVSTAENALLRKEIEAAQQGLVEAKKQANDAVAKADQAIADAGFAKLDATTAKNNALTAVNTANTAKTNAGTALTTAQTSLTSSSDALTKAGQALAKATATESETGNLTTSYDALTKTVALKAEKEELNIVKSTVTKQTLDISANATAIGLKADKTLVDNINLTVSKHSLDIKADADGLLLKADSSLVNTLKGTVDSQGLAITAASNGLTLKADTSVVNTIKGTVDTHTNQIKVVSDGMALKAESSLVNTINGTVNTHTNQIAANSTAISARLTSAQVDTLINGKGYATTTALNATSTTLSASIVEVSTDLSNLEIGGRNLLERSATKEFEKQYTETSSGYTGFKQFYIKDVDRKLKAGDSVTVSFDVQMQVGTELRVYDSNNNKSIMFGTKTFRRIGTSKRRLYWTFITEVGIKGSTEHTLDFYNANNPDNFSISNIKIEKGNKATDWSPAPEDMATVERAVQIEANLNGLQTTVSNKADKTQITQLAGQISTKVESATYNSKMTQLDSEINLRVTAGQVDASILSDKRIKDTRTTNQIPSWYYANYPRQTVEEFKMSSKIGVPNGSNYGQLTTNVPWSDSSGGYITQSFRTNSGVYTRTGITTAWTAWTRTADVENLVAQINLSPKGVLIQGKNIQLDGDVSMTTAFVNTIKAIEVIADKITSGTLNAANVNIINLNASKITAGIMTGANFGLNLGTGEAIFYNPTSTNGNLILQQGQIRFEAGSQSIRTLKYTAEGLWLEPGPNNIGTNKNSSIWLQGGGTGSHQYVHFRDADNINQRITAVSREMFLFHGAGGQLNVEGYASGSASGVVVAGKYITAQPGGNYLRIFDNVIQANETATANIYIQPNGQGELRISRGTAHYKVVAGSFVQASSRSYKTNIVNYELGALSLINSLKVVEYDLKTDLTNNIDNKQIGFISEDSNSISSNDGKGIDLYRATAINIRGVQQLSEIAYTQDTRLTKLKLNILELDKRTASENDILKAKVKILEEKIQKLESAA